MTDRIYPASKPNGSTPAAAATAPPPRFLPPKSQLYNPTQTQNHHPYRQQPIPHRRHRHRRSCFCLCCFWSIVVLIALSLLAVIAGAAIYVLYQPDRPTFSISTLRISEFNLTTAPDFSTHLSTKLNLTISSKNPNKKLVFYYDPITISAVTNEEQIANGSFKSFTSDPNNITIIHSSLTSVSQVVVPEFVTSTRSDLKKRAGLSIKILMDTKMIVKMDGLKSKKVGIRVTCDGIRSSVPKGKNSTSIANTSKSRCKLDLRVKIWKWTF